MGHFHKDILTGNLWACCASHTSIINLSWVSARLVRGFRRTDRAQVTDYGRDVKIQFSSAGIICGRLRARLAAALLRFQRMEGAQADREAALYAPESGGARVGARTGAVAVEQLSELCFGGSGRGANQSVG